MSSFNDFYLVTKKYRWPQKGEEDEEKLANPFISYLFNHPFFLRFWCPFHLFSLTKEERKNLYLFTRYFEQPYDILGDIDGFFEFYSKSFICEVTKGNDYILLWYQGF